MTFNDGSVKNYTKDQAIKFETDQCSKSLKMSKVFNNQKSLIIGSIDCYIENIQDFLRGKVEARHFKHAPFSFIGRIGEKLFGLGKGDELPMILFQNRWQWAHKGLGACKRLTILQGRLY